MHKASSLSSTSVYWKDIFLLILFLGILFFTLLGARPLFVPDEGRYAEIIREMAATNNYITPYLNHIKYFEKPVLFYWLGSAAVKLMGLNLWSVRSINALLGLLGALTTYLVTTRLYGRMTGILAALILSTSVLYFVMAHMVSLDLPVTTFLSFSLYSFLLGTQQPKGKTRRWLLYIAYASAALAVLTKGLIGIVFPGLIIGTWIVLTGQWRLLKEIYLPSGLLIFLLIAAPWHVLAHLKNPEFFYFYFIEQHFLRYTTLDVGHYQPVWFFIPTLLIGFFPWTAFLFQSLYFALKQSSKNKIDLFFFLWFALVFIFFSFSKSKLIPYILPIFPPLAILTARYWQTLIQQPKTKTMVLSYLILMGLLSCIAYTFYIFPQRVALPDPLIAITHLHLASLILFLGIIFSLFLINRKQPKGAFMVTFASTWLFLLSAFSAMPAIDTRTIQPLAQHLKSILQPRDEVITYNQYYQDLPFYLERRITILNWQNELMFGMQHQNTKEWMISDATFWQRWHSPNRIFVILSQGEYIHLKKDYPYEHFFLLGKTLTNVLISNKNSDIDGLKWMSGHSAS